MFEGDNHTRIVGGLDACVNFVTKLSRIPKMLLLGGQHVLLKDVPEEWEKQLLAGFLANAETSAGRTGILYMSSDLTPSPVGLAGFRLGPNTLARLGVVLKPTIAMLRVSGAPSSWGPDYFYHVLFQMVEESEGTGQYLLADLEVEAHRVGFVITVADVSAQLLLQHFGHGVVLEQGTREYTLTFHPHIPDDAIVTAAAIDDTEPVEFDPAVVGAFISTPLGGGAHGDGDQDGMDASDDEGAGLLREPYVVAPDGDLLASGDVNGGGG